MNDGDFYREKNIIQSYFSDEYVLSETIINNKYNLKKYCNDELPTVFFGITRNTVDFFNDMKCKKILCLKNYGDLKNEIYLNINKGTEIVFSEEDWDILENNKLNKNEINYFILWNKFQNYKFGTSLKEKWREYAFTLTKYIDLFDIDNTIKKNNDNVINNDAVFVEFRELPHIYFLLKNAIIKLNKYFSFKIVCGNKNYEYMRFINNMLNNICEIIIIDIDECTRDEYNDMLLNTKFWELFDCEKILIFQEDSIIFNENIKKFLVYDYIGAPWKKSDNTNYMEVGNGGFSLRDRKKMLQCLEKPYDDKLFQRINKCSLNNVPEDIYFCNMLKKYEIGNVASKDVAKKFSQEEIKSENPVGGHCWWLSEKKYNFDNCFSQIFKCIALCLSKNYVDIDFREISKLLNKYIKMGYLIMIFVSNEKDLKKIKIKECNNQYFKILDYKLLFDSEFIKSLNINHYIYVNKFSYDRFWGNLFI